MSGYTLETFSYAAAYEDGAREGGAGDGPTRASLRNPAGHDASRIHLVRPSRMSGYSVLLCSGRAVETFRPVPHGIGPTCRKCKALA